MIRLLRKIWLDLSRIGVSEKLDFEAAKRVRIINRFSIIGIYVALSYTLFLLLLSEPVLAGLDFAIAVAGIIVMLLQKKQHYKAAAIFMFVSIPLILLSIDIAYDGAGAYFYFFSLFILAYYIFPQKRLLFPLLMYLLVLFVFSMSFHYLLGFKPSETAQALAPYFFFINFLFAFLIAGIFLQIFVTEHIGYQNKLEASVAETLKQNQKITTLLKELSHRTKNNLQFISSLLNLQAKQSKNQSIREKILAIRSRINAIALVHKNLYAGQIDSRISIRNYISDITLALINIGADDDDSIELETRIEDIYLPLDISITMGVIVNELLTNSLKHGLRSGKGKKLSVSVTLANQKKLEVHISDSGSGINKLTNSENTSFGIDIVRSLIKQEKGEIRFWEDNGNHVCFSFNIE